MHPRSEHSPWSSLTQADEEHTPTIESEECGTIADNFSHNDDLTDYPGSSDEALDGLEPGCLIGVARGHRHGLGILTQIFEMGSPIYQCYTTEGRYMHMPQHSRIFCVPQFASAEEIKGILPFLPLKPPLNKAREIDHSNEHPVPRHAGSHLLKKLIDFETESDEFYRKYAHRLDNLYERISLPNRSVVRHLGDVARQLSNKGDDDPITHSMTWAVLKAVHKSVGLSILAQKPGNNLKVLVMPVYKKQTIQNVGDWVREYQESATQETVNSFDGAMSESLSESKNPISRFVKKARRLVLESRKRRDVGLGGGVGPDRYTYKPLSGSSSGNSPCVAVQPSESVTFDSDDRVILHFLSSWILTRELTAPDRVKSIGPMILRALGLYEGYDLSLATGYTFLKEVGLILPWENRSIYRPTIDLPGPEYRPSTSVITPSSTSPAHDRTQTFSVDTMEAFRQDLPSGNVYCIDAQSTTERDDGLSIERVDDSTSWVHVHVANPSAFIKPTDKVAIDAAAMVSNLYLPERRYSILPSSLAEERFSLADGAPVITFSAKVSNEGEILDNRISHNRLQGTVMVTYKQVDEALQPGAKKAQSESLSFEVGQRHNVPASAGEKRETALSEMQVAELRKLWELSIALRARKRCILEQWWQHSLPKNSLSVDLGVDHPPFHRYFVRPCRAIGDPWIASRPPETILDINDNSPQRLVPTFMMMACELAAGWCKERRIPAFYSGTPRDPVLERLRGDFYDNVAKPAIDRYGSPPYQVRVRFATLMNGSQYLSMAIPHDHIPAESYLRATSPLRRWVDLVAHWQIEAALREEARIGKEAILASDPDHYLQLSKHQIEAKLPHVSERIAILKDVEKTTETHWLSSLFFRAHYFDEAPMPATITLSIYRVYPAPIGWASQLGMVCALAPCEALRSGSIYVGDVWECKIKEIHCYSEGIKLDPIRLIERNEMGLD